MSMFFVRTRSAIAGFATPVGVIGVFFCLALIVAGGASRADAASQIVVRLASIATIAALLVRRPTLGNIIRVRRMMLFASLIGLLILVQLVPLPPAMWTALPGRIHDVDLDKLIGAQSNWRPLNLTPDLGWNAAMAMLPVFATIAVLAQVEETHDARPLTFVAAIAVISALLGLAQLADGPGSWLRFYEVTSLGSAVGLFANRNHNATLLSVALPTIAFLGTRLNSEGRDGKLLAIFSFAAWAMILLLIPATGSRFGLVAGVLGLVGSLFWWGKLVRRVAKRVARSTQIAIVCGASAVVALTVAAAVTNDRAQAVRRLLSASIGSDERLTIGSTLWQMVQTYFPAGSGFGSFDPVFRRFEPVDYLTDQYLNHAHNDLLQIMIEGGLPAMVLLLIFLIWWGREAVHAWRDRSGRQATQFARLGTMITAIILLASLVDYPLRTPLIAAVFTVASWCMSLPRATNGSAVMAAKRHPKDTK